MKTRSGQEQGTVRVMRRAVWRGGRQQPTGWVPRINEVEGKGKGESGVVA